MLWGTCETDDQWQESFHEILWVGEKLIDVSEILVECRGIL